MKTEVTKSYKWGFTLPEQELRRLFQTCHEHIKENVDTPRILIQVFLRDGSVIESDKVDDILSLENAGTKRIQRLSLNFDTGMENPDWKISIQFEDAEKNPRSWTSISTKVVGQTRDWAFLAAADIEERIKRVKSLAPIYIMENRYFVLVPTFLSFILVLMAMQPIYNYGSAADKLESAYKSGAITNPIEAMIFLERAKEASQNIITILPLLLLAFFAPLVLLFGLGRLLTAIAPSYNFYWGDYITYLNKRKSAQNVFWTVIVLGIIVSLISAYIFKLLP
jgi:hypothetical protein